MRFVISGTDTNIGKTVFSAGLTGMLSARADGSARLLRNQDTGDQFGGLSKFGPTAQPASSARIEAARIEAARRGLTRD